MKWLATLLLLAGTCHAQNLISFPGQCAKGGQAVAVLGGLSNGTAPIGSSMVANGTGVIASYPNCLVSVFATGTQNTVPLFQNNLVPPTALTDPFTANADGSFLFYVAAGTYDVVLSGGGLPSPFTLTAVSLGQGSGSGGTVQSLSATNPLILSPNPTTTTGTVGLSTACVNQVWQWSGTAWGCVTVGAGGAIPNPFIFNSNIPNGKPGLPGASTTSVAINQNGRLDQAASGAQFYDDFLTKADIYEADAFNWQQLPTSPLSLTGGTPATVTIACVRGIDPSFLVVNSDTLAGDYYVTIGTTGTAETVYVTATTCTATSNGASGTITFTPKNNHGAGYSIGSAVAGTQEAINWAEVSVSHPARYAIVREPCGYGIPWNAPVETHGNFIVIDGQGCAAVTLNHLQQGIILGDQAYGVGNFFFNTVKDLSIFSGWTGATPQVNLVQSVTQAGAPGPCTYAVTFAANHDFYLYEQVVLGGFLEYNQIAGVRQVASIPAANEITFTTRTCTALTGQIYSGGWAVPDNVGIEDDLGTDGVISNVAIGGGINGDVGFSYGFSDISDEHTVAIHLNNYNSGAVVRNCTTEWCGAFVYAPGASGYANAGASAILKCVDCNIGGGNGNGVDWWSGNDLTIVGSLIQNWAQFGLRASQRRGAFGKLDLSGVHFEGNCSNPFGTVGCSGLISEGYATTFTGVNASSGPPSFGTNGNQALEWIYYVMPVNSASDALCTSQPNDQRCVLPGGQPPSMGNGPVLPIGYAKADSSTGGTFTVSWPAIREATSYVLMRVTAPSNPGVVGISQPYGTGNYLIASALNPATVCSGGSGQTAGEPVCSYADSVGLTPGSVTVPYYGIGAYVPFIDFWPCNLFVGPGSDLGGAGSISLTSYFGVGSGSICNANTLGTNQIVVTAVAQNLQFQGAPVVNLFPLTIPNDGPGLSQASLFPAKNGLFSTDDTDLTNIKGVLNFGTHIATFTYPLDVITLWDTAFTKTLSTVGNRPPNDAGDSAIGLDQAGGVSQRAATSISEYINSVNDNSSFLYRLTSSSALFKVQVNTTSGYSVSGVAGFSGTKTAGSCVLTISGGIITNVTGC